MRWYARVLSIQTNDFDSHSFVFFLLLPISPTPFLNSSDTQRMVALPTQRSENPSPIRAKTHGHFGSSTTAAARGAQRERSGVAQPDTRGVQQVLFLIHAACNVGVHRIPLPSSTQAGVRTTSLACVFKHKYVSTPCVHSVAMVSVHVLSHSYPQRHMNVSGCTG